RLAQSTRHNRCRGRATYYSRIGPSWSPDGNRSRGEFIESESMIPYDDIDAVFFDSGGTLVGMDFTWISEELGRFGVPSQAEALARAEAGARPAVSARLSSDDPPEEVFPFLLASMIKGALPTMREEIVSDLIVRLTPVLLPGGKGLKLWSDILPGAREALIELSRLGLRMAVVSNSDGSVEEGLKALNLRRFFDAVIDSKIVGYAKPDPRIFDLALHAVGTTASRTIYVGDMYHVDVVGARAAGLHPVLIDPHGDWGGVDCVRVASLVELSTNLRRLD